MLRLLALACVVALGAADQEAEPAAAANPIYVHQDELELLRRGHDHHDQHEHHYGDRKAHTSDDILHKQHQIIESVYSPDYYEPTLILDYRYLKSGGRDYTRGPGGQILILPHGVHSHEHKEHRDYDSLIEFLRLRYLAQSEAKRQRKEDEERSHWKYADAHGHANEHDRKHGHDQWH